MQKLNLFQKTLIGCALTFLGLILIWPLAFVFQQAFHLGWTRYLYSLNDPDTLYAIGLTITITLLSLPFNLLFGLCAAWCIARFEFKGKLLLISLIDLPFAISPVVVGLAFLSILSARTPFGSWLLQHNLQVVFALPGMLLATLFVTLPFIARELIPLMHSQGSEEEEAALSLGASSLGMFFKVTLPNIKWGLLYGVILANARAMGEFGAVSSLSGHIRGETNTLPLHVEALYHDYDPIGAFAAASILAGLAFLTVLLKALITRQQRK